MDVRVVRVRVDQRLVGVPVAVSGAGGHLWSVFVNVVLVVGVAVLVRLLAMRMLVLLR